VIRRITHTDIPTIINLLLTLHTESPVYGLVEPDPEYVTRTLTAMIDSKSFIGYIATDGTGLMLGQISPTWYNPVPSAYEHILYVVPEKRGTGLAIRMVRNFEADAKWAEAEYAYLGASTGINDEATNRLYERLGYSRVGGGYRKAL
jgi:RimJ/RimL family protein N-acetyltransferase